VLDASCDASGCWRHVQHCSFFGRASILIASLAFTIPGCQGQNDDGTSGGTGDIEVCPDCPEGQDVYLCIVQGVEVTRCYEDIAAAQASCGAIPGDGVVGNAPIPCDNQEPAPGASWSPGDFVSYDAETDTQEIDRELVLAVLEDPNLLLLDRTRVEWQGDRFELQRVAEGDLAAELGVQDGDVLSEINGYPLSSMEEVVKAYDALREESSLAVAVMRGDATLVLTYRIVDDAR